MAYRRLMIAAALMMAAVYLKLTLPAFGTELLPALRSVLAEEQVVIGLPGSAAWQDTD